MTTPAYLKKMIISTIICPFPPLAFSSLMLELPHNCSSYFAKVLSCNTSILLPIQRFVLSCYYVYSRYPLIEFTFLPLTILFNLSDKDLHRIKQNIWKCCHVIFFNWIRVSWSFTNQTSFPLWSWNTHYFDVLFFFYMLFVCIIWHELCSKKLFMTCKTELVTDYWPTRH